MNQRALNTNTNQESTLLAAILLLASVLRFYHFSSWSLCDEELNAISRSQTVHWFFRTGETQNGTPTGIEGILFFWMKIFGQSAFAVRLPFVLLGIASVYLAYRISDRWFGKTSALFVALVMSLSGFFILNSQLAGSFAPGLFFSLWMVWFWAQLVFPVSDEPPKRNVYLRFMITFAICCCLHYASFIFAITVWIVGIFFCKKNYLWKYIAFGTGSILLFIPYSFQMFEQIRKGALFSFTSPSGDALPEHIFGGFNHSDFFLWPAVAIAAGSFIFYYKEWRFTKFHLLSLLFFGIPFCLANFLSGETDPLLKNSTLLFSFPFLLFFLFSYFRKTPDIKIVSMLLLLAVSGLWSLAGDDKFYSTRHFGTFRELTETTKEWDGKYGGEKITRTANVANPFYLDYYFTREGKEEKFSIYRVRTTETLGDLKTIIDNSKTDYFLYAWSSVDDLPEVKPLIETQFPELVEARKFFNSAIYLFKRNSSTKLTLPKLYFNEAQSFERTGTWENDSVFRSKEIARTGIYSVKLDDHVEYSPTFTRRMNAMKPPTDSSTIIARVWAYLPDTASDAELVVSFESLKNVYQWHSQKLNNFVHEPKKWTEVIVANRIPSLPSSEDIVKVYVWNPKKKNLFLDDFSVEVVSE